jgi:hypothetical protein
MKPLLVTVTGHRTNTLKHQLMHYKNEIKDAFIVAYEHENSDKSTKEEVEEIAKEQGFKIHTVRTHRPFDWEQVTNIYNEIKDKYPDDWWIISDDDELQIYWEPIEDLIQDCEKHGWEYVSGGFVDRIGLEGTFPEINPESNLWETFPVAAFFRYPLSKACPNKTCLAKGRIKVSNGQHYIKEGQNVVWGAKGWLHPKRYPVNRNFVQVHHFKWDDTVFQRLLDVANVKQKYAYSEEYQLMYDSIKNNNFRIDINNSNFFAMNIPEKNYQAYTHWGRLKNLILHI